MIEICLKDDNMHIFVMINALICINNYVITCIISMLSDISLILTLNHLILVSLNSLFDQLSVNKKFVKFHDHFAPQFNV